MSAPLSTTQANSRSAYRHTVGNVKFGAVSPPCVAGDLSGATAIAKDIAFSIGSSASPSIFFDTRKPSKSACVEQPIVQGPADECEATDHFGGQALRLAHDVLVVGSLANPCVAIEAILQDPQTVTLVADSVFAGTKVLLIDPVAVRENAVPTP